MIAFEVWVNDEHVCTAGIGDLGVLSAILNWVRRGPENSQDGISFEEELRLQIDGLDQRAHIAWLDREMTVGDSVSLKIVSATSVDAPASSRPRDDAAAIERGERRYFEHLKAKYASEKPPPKARKARRPKRP